MTSLMQRLQSELVAALKARDLVRADALRMLKCALWGARDERAARLALGRYRKRAMALLDWYATLGPAADAVADRLVLDVAVCDALLPALSAAELDQVVAAVVRAAPPGRRKRPGALVGEVMRAVPGQVDGAEVRARVEQAVA